MRITIVNACHPDRHHVCAFRGTTFAEILTKAGHQVVLITPPLPGLGEGDDQTTLAQKFEDHDWTKYCHIVGGFKDGSLLPSVRTGKVPAPLRQMIIGYNYLTRGNIYHDWIGPSSALLPIIASEFKPDIVWAIFGNTSCWVMGQTLADTAHCPWVADIKDNWQAFLPYGLKKAMAHRFTDAAAFTVLSQAHAETYPSTPGQEFKSIYNGISPSLMVTASKTAKEQKIREEILITGSLYQVDVLAKILQAIASWPKASPDQKIVYAGGDTEIFDRAIQALEIDLNIQKLGNLAPNDLWQRQRCAKLNVYVRNPPNLIHHKLLELLAANRPILAYPGETDESVMIANDLKGEFFPCTTEAEVHQALEHSFSKNTSATLNFNDLQQFSSQHQADMLATLFTKIVEQHGTNL
ncbi:MAG: hypothetical protein GKS01_11130 [Alphaproteobacteria bacterium]|nr:hypothetical protein [Alphaproteobacteria bacterium]